MVWSLFLTMASVRVCLLPCNKVDSNPFMWENCAFKILCTKQSVDLKAHHPFEILNICELLSCITKTELIGK